MDKVHGTSFSCRFISLHFLAYQLGPLVCSVITKAHVLTACDITNKFGTKAAKLKCNPEMYLMTFGKIDDDLSHRNAEQYLEIAVYLKSICITVDELCYETYS